MSDMKKPEKGAKPKKITTKNKPGHTGPGGANPASGAEVNAAKARDENANGTQRSN